jgi:hypothetical protein
MQHGANSVDFSDADSLDTLVEMGRLQFQLREYRAAAEHFKAAANLPVPATSSSSSSSSVARARARELAAAVEARHMLGVCLASVGDVRAAVVWWGSTGWIKLTHNP